MFLRGTIRKKNGKEHRYWSIVENKRVAGGKVRQRHVFYLGEINASQERAWRKSIEVLDEQADRPRTLALFPENRCEGLLPEFLDCPAAPVAITPMPPPAMGGLLVGA